MNSFGGPSRETLLQSTLPYLIAAFCILLSGMPLGLMAFPQLSMGLFLVPLFVVSLRSDNDFAPVFFILLGLLADILMEAPLGYWALLACLVYMLSSGQKQVLQNAAFTSHWASFFVVIFLVYLAGFVISLMRDDLAVQLGGHFLSALLTGLCYPIIAGPLNLLYAGGSMQEGL